MPSSTSARYRNLIVVGASLGGIEALPRFVAGLSPQLNAAVLVVMHLGPSSPGYLPRLLQSATRWPTRHARDGEIPEPGNIYVAVPDKHLLIENACMRLTRGPRESHARPSIDALFRSAAYYAGPRVIGIVLTGRLDDGTAGLWAIKDRGGVTIVQSVDEAAHPSMPRSALQHVAVDHVLRIDEMSKCLLALTGEPLPSSEADTMQDEKLETEVAIALRNNSSERAVLKLGVPSLYTCPDCHGAMVRIREGAVGRFRCHTGHAFTARSMVDQGPALAERTIAAAQAQLEEYRMLLDELTSGPEENAPDVADYTRRLKGVDSLIQRLRAMAADPALESPAQD